MFRCAYRVLYRKFSLFLSRLAALPRGEDPFPAAVVTVGGDRPERRFSLGRTHSAWAPHEKRRCPVCTPVHTAGKGWVGGEGEGDGKGREGGTALRACGKPALYFPLFSARSAYSRFRASRENGRASERARVPRTEEPCPRAELSGLYSAAQRKLITSSRGTARGATRRAAPRFARLLQAD